MIGAGHCVNDEAQGGERRRLSSAAFVAVIAIAAVLIQGCDKPATDNLITGNPFPPITLTRLDGGTRAIDDYQGKLVVLNVWATWCGPCRRELPSLQRLSDTLDSSRFAVVALSVDSEVHVVREYLLEREITLTSYIDRDQRLANDIFGVRVYPATFVIAPDGRLLAQIAGERQWDTPQTIAALRDAHAGKPLNL